MKRLPIYMFYIAIAGLTIMVITLLFGNGLLLSEDSGIKNKISQSNQNEIINVDSLILSIEANSNLDREYKVIKEGTVWKDSEKSFKLIVDRIIPKSWHRKYNSFEGFVSYGNNYQSYSDSFIIESVRVGTSYNYSYNEKRVSIMITEINIKHSFITIEIKK
jgi:hypothetical protein